MPQSNFSHAQEAILAAAQSRQECADFIRLARVELAETGAASRKTIAESRFASVERCHVLTLEHAAGTATRYCRASRRPSSPQAKGVGAPRRRRLQSDPSTADTLANLLWRRVAAECYFRVAHGCRSQRPARHPTLGRHTLHR